MQKKTGEKVEWGEVIFAGIEGALLGTFFGFCGMLAVSMSSALIFIALGCTSLIFAVLSLVQAKADWENGDYDLVLFDAIFAGICFGGAYGAFKAAGTCSSASETAGTSTDTSPENTNTATNNNKFTFEESGREIDISRWNSSENGAWGPLKDEGGMGLGRNAPYQVEPGTRYLEGQYIRDGKNGTGRVEPWKAYYDEYGRQIGRTDYNAPDPSKNIPALHHHEIIWTRVGKTNEKVHYQGEYKP